MEIKSKLKRIIPVSMAKADRYRDDIHKENEMLSKKLVELQKSVDNLKKRMDNVANTNSKELETLHEDMRNILEMTSRESDEIKALQGMIDNVRDDIQHVNNEIQTVHTEYTGNTKDIFTKLENLPRIKRSADEAVWGLVFHDSIKDSSWLTEQQFFPGRWAVGYQYLYALYRVLGAVRPKSILELGLGQSSRMITQYVESVGDALHRVTEHDPEWIEFFRRDNVISDKTEIVLLDICREPYEDDERVVMYKEFREKLGDRKYDFISVDAPFGYEAIKYARVDILSLIPDCLADSWTIMVDDANRAGEKHMIELLKEKLNLCGIEFTSGWYCGQKDTFIIASMDRKFVCSL